VLHTTERLSPYQAFFTLLNYVSAFFHCNQHLSIKMLSNSRTLLSRDLTRLSRGIRSIQQRYKSSSSSSLSRSLFTWYAKKLDSHPLLTKGITSGLIAGTADVICQLLTSDEDSLDWLRAGRFLFLGAVWVGPVTHYWYGALSTRILPGANTAWKTAQRVIVDQFAFAPMFVPSFLGLMWVLEGRENIPSQIQQNVPEIIVAGCSLWVPAMTINFGMVPMKYHVLFSNVVALLWDVYLSYKSASIKKDLILKTDEEKKR
jgi:hypothetical protein